MGRKRSASAGLPASTTTSRIKPLLPVARLSLCPYCTARPPLTMMSACGSNRLTRFSPPGPASPPVSRGPALEHPALALGDDARDQRQIMIDRGAPPLGRHPDGLGQ